MIFCIDNSIGTKSADSKTSDTGSDFHLTNLAKTVNEFVKSALEFHEKRGKFPCDNTPKGRWGPEPDTKYNAVSIIANYNYLK